MSKVLNRNPACCGVSLLQLKCSTILSVTQSLFLISMTMIMCNATFGFFYVYMHRRGIDYVNHFLLTSGYFLSIAVFTAFVFWKVLVPVLNSFSIVPLIVLGFFMCIQSILYVYIPKFLE